MKDFGVEAMSCAVLGQEHADHHKRQQRAHRLKHHQRQQLSKTMSIPQKCNTYATTTDTVNDEETKTSPRAKLQQSSTQSQHALEEEASSPWDCSDLPPLAGTPLFTAASARSCSATKIRPFSAAVTLDGNPAISARVVREQGALAGLGEASLFGGCVLPETVLSGAVTTFDTSESFWRKNSNTRKEPQALRSGCS